MTRDLPGEVVSHGLILKLDLSIEHQNRCVSEQRIEEVLRREGQRA